MDKIGVALFFSGSSRNECRGYICHLCADLLLNKGPERCSSLFASARNSLVSIISLSSIVGFL